MDNKILEQPAVFVNNFDLAPLQNNLVRLTFSETYGNSDKYVRATLLIRRQDLLEAMDVLEKTPT